MKNVCKVMEDNTWSVVILGIALLVISLLCILICKLKYVNLALTLLSVGAILILISIGVKCYKIVNDDMNVLYDRVHELKDQESEVQTE